MNKRDELIALATSALLSEQSVSLSQEDARTLATKLIDAFATIREPKVESLTQAEFVIANYRGGAESIKAGNIRLNWRKLGVAVASGTITIAGITTMPWLSIFAAWVVYDNVNASLHVPITELEAKVFWALWKLADEFNRVPKDGLLQLVNDVIITSADHPISEAELKDAIQSLRHKGCIKESTADSTKWFLCEWIKRSYR